MTSCLLELLRQLLPTKCKTMPWRVKANKEQAREYLETRNLQVYYQRKLYKMLDLKCLSTLNSKVLWPNEASTYL